MKPVIDPTVMVISGILGIISIYLSALIPSFFAGRISPLVAISSRTSITKEKIKRRKNRVIGKIFGFEASLSVPGQPSNSPPSNTQSPEQMKPNLGPLLQVDIPDVQMERYSVMFGGLLGKDQPSQPDRRSKTMEDIEVPKTQVGRSFLRLQWASSTNAFNRIHHPLQSFPRLRDGQRHHRHHARNLRPLALPCSRTPKSAKPPKSWALRIYPEAQALYTGAKPPWPKHVELRATAGRTHYTSRAPSHEWTMPRHQTHPANEPAPSRKPVSPPYQKHDLSMARRSCLENQRPPMCSRTAKMRKNQLPTLALPTRT